MTLNGIQNPERRHRMGAQPRLDAEDQLRGYLDRKVRYRNGDVVELRVEFPLHPSYDLKPGDRMVVVSAGRTSLDCDYVGENVHYAVSVPKNKVKLIERGEPYRR